MVQLFVFGRGFDLGISLKFKIMMLIKRKTNKQQTHPPKKRKKKALTDLYQIHVLSVYE